jgi:hypothetical protein
MHESTFGSNAGTRGAAPSTRRRKTAHIVCSGDGSFWTTPREFWRYVREGVVTPTGERPLTGRFEGHREKMIVRLRGILLDDAAPEHKDAILKSYARRVR